MRNIDKGIELTGRTEENLMFNECPRSFGIVTKGCNETDCKECWEEEFTVLRKPSLPEGFQCFENEKIDEVYYSDDEIIITGIPSNGHCCDLMGCTSVSHVIFRANINNRRKQA